MQAGISSEAQLSLVERVQMGGAEGQLAEAELCQRYAGRVRAYGVRHLRDRGCVDDYVQKVLMDLVVALRGGRLQNGELLERFLWGICRNTRSSFVREHTRQPTPHEPGELEQREMNVPAFETTDLGKLSRCMGTLQPRAREVITYCYHFDLDAEEVGARLKLSPSHVRVLRHRSLQLLRACLERREMA